MLFRSLVEAAPARPRRRAPAHLAASPEAGTAGDPRHVGAALARRRFTAPGLALVLGVAASLASQVLLLL